MKVEAVIQEYPYERIEKDLREQFLKEYEPEMERTEVVAIARRLAGGSDERGSVFAEGFVRGLLRDGSKYANKEPDELLGTTHRKDLTLGYDNGFFTRRELHGDWR